MNYFYLVVSLVLVNLFITNTHGQEKAVTEGGDTVILKNDGTWLYLEDYNPSASYTTPQNIKKVMKKPSNANKTTSATPKDYVVSYDSRLWKKTNPNQLNQEAELGFELKEGDVYGLIIYENIEIDLENLQSVALENAKRIGKNMSVTLKEYRVVNKDTILCTQMEGTLKGMDIIYYTYFYSDSDGSMQFHTFTSQKMFPKSKGKMEDLLNGLQIKE